jgi:hypothetical protein
MNVADQIEDHQSRCLPHLLSLRMLARGEAAPLPRLAAAEVTQATQAILTEARTVAGDGPGPGIFLEVRLRRLAAAAEDAIAAAWAGDLGQLRRHLARFDTLTSAIWTVQQAVRGPGGA